MKAGQLDVEQRLREFFARYQGDAVAVYLYGSVARGTAGARSDVDVAVLYRTRPAQTLDAGPLDLEGELERVLHRPVQVVVLNAAAPDLVHRVLRDGILLLDRDRSMRIQFEVRLRNEYFDLEPVRRAYRERRPTAPRS